MDGFLDCGRYLGGFAHLRCASCGSAHLVAFSCQTRDFCPSCQAERAALFAEFLSQVVLLAVPHTSPAVAGRRPGTSSRVGAGCESRGAVFAVPKALRGLFERERRLLGLLVRSAYDATRGWR